MNQDSDWLSNEDDPLEGFEFVKQRDPVTDGIDVLARIQLIIRKNHF